MSKLTELGQMLLPWYVNNSLSESEKSKMDLLTHNNESFKKNVEKEKEFAKRFQAEDPELRVILQQQPQAFEQLRRKVASESSGVTSTSGNFSRMRRRLNLPLAITAGMLMVAVGTYLVIEVDSSNENTDFTVLTSPPQFSGVVAQLVFAPTTPPEVIDKLFKNAPTEYLSGPSSNGVYRVRIDDQQELEYWRKHDKVIWAEIEAK